MIRFECDYAEGAHEDIMKALIASNNEQTSGYGEDIYSENAKSYIRKQCKREDIDVHFLVGGTQANITVISSVLRPHQGVISAHTGHINVHESGGIEAAGHKVLTVDSMDGKLKARQIEQVYEEHYNDSSREHMVQPGMVYISHPTENGTIYTKQELTKLREVCDKCGLVLYMDGARLGYGLAAEDSDLSLSDIAKLCDIFYIGGTKVGALFGEAVVITNEERKKDFRYFIKQRGGLLAKGRLLGIQFGVLFEHDLYHRISKDAVNLAMEMKQAFVDKGYEFLYESSTNQQFPIIPDRDLLKLAEEYSFTEWKNMGNSYTAVRFCTSWATNKENVKKFIQYLNEI